MRSEAAPALGVRWLAAFFLAPRPLKRHKEGGKPPYSKSWRRSYPHESLLPTVWLPRNVQGEDMGLEPEGETAMSITIEIDEALLEKACQLGHHPSKQEAIAEALKEYIEHKNPPILELTGAIDYYEDYDIKQERRRKCP